MYGTVARFCIKQGQEEEFLAAFEEQEGNVEVEGQLGYYIYRLDNEPGVFYLSVIFASRDTYWANARSPEQDARYRKLAEYFAEEPQWFDGEIVRSEFVQPERLMSAAL
jgi:quinol monooxygenase YgiN